MIKKRINLVSIYDATLKILVTKLFSINKERSNKFCEVDDSIPMMKLIRELVEH